MLHKRQGSVLSKIYNIVTFTYNRLSFLLLWLYNITNPNKKQYPILAKFIFLYSPNTKSIFKFSEDYLWSDTHGKLPFCPAN